MRSACAKGVVRPLAMSLVTCTPPMGRLSMCTSSPSKKTAMDVVPPPMSMQVTPSFFSSSTRHAKAEAYGDTTLVSTPR